MVAETLRKKPEGSPLVDMHHPDWQIQQEPTSQTMQNHTSGKPNATACAEMIKQQCPMTSFPVMTHSVENQTPKLGKQTSRRKPATIHLQHVARKVKK